MTDESLPLGALYPGLFTPRLAVLDHKLTEPREPFEGHKLHWTLRALPYNVDAAYWAMYDLLVALRDIGREFQPHVGRNVVRMLTPGESRKIYFAIDDFMVRGRRAQNALASCVRLVVPGGRSLPPSMSKLVKGLRTGKYEVPLGLQCLLVDYWTTHGVQIKRYRDIGEHHALIWSYVSVTAPEGRPLVSVLLPSPEPEERPHRVRFGKPEIHAQPFVIEQFEALVEVVNRVVNRLITRLPGPDRRSFGYTGGRPIPRGEQGYPGMSPDEVVRFARQLIGRVRGLPSGEWPEPEKPGGG